jgi:putative endonuclease
LVATSPVLDSERLAVCDQRKAASVADHLDLGKHGEDLAANFLKKLGYKILVRNYRVKSGEIDIIARDGNCLVFVEVKTRTSDSFAQPIESVGFHKQQKLRSLADRYLASHVFLDCDVRFDVVSIVQRGGRPEIEHIRNAF